MRPDAPTTKAVMIRFLARRLAIAVGIMLVLSFMMYWLLNLAMDPLGDLRTSTAPNKDQLIEARIRALQLDLPWYQRYWNWLSGVIQGDLGKSWVTQQSVNDMLPNAISQSVQLVFSATILALLLGVTVGVISALRQYTNFDYAMTLVTFVLYSLPVFWVAVLLKQFLAIEFNDYLADPVVVWPVIIVISLVAGLFWMGALGGQMWRRLGIFTTATLVTGGAMLFIMTSGWLQNPSLGPTGVTIVGIVAALVVSVLFAGLQNRRALYATLTTAAVGALLYYPLWYFFNDYVTTWPILLVLLAVTLGISALIGFLWGGPDRNVSIRNSALVGFIIAVTYVIDQLLQAYPAYLAKVGGRPVPTLGSSTPNFSGDFWQVGLDRVTHLILPTIALVLISFAGYVRYERGAMLEVLNQDYIRTARSKGLPERVVIVRHALRNALLPLASIVPPDLIAMIGGAVITERIFSWSGMGTMFVASLGGSDIDPVMVYILITGGLAMIANIIADILYSLLDPRIRVNS